MSKSLPFFKFIPSEWNDGSISLEDYEVQGVFINVCSYYWSREGDLTEVTLLKRFKDCKDVIKQLAKDKFILLHEGRVTIQFLDEQLAELLERREKLSKAGRKGGLSSAQARLKHIEEDKEEEVEEEKEEEIYASEGRLSITWDEFNKLSDKYGVERAEDTVNRVLNWPKNSKYKNLYRTCIQWLSREDKANAPREETPEEAYQRKLGYLNRD